MSIQESNLKPALERLLRAVDATPRPTLRALMHKTGTSSTSVVKYQLEKLASLGCVALEWDDNGRMHVDGGADFVAGWDMAARICGNPEA